MLPIYYDDPQQLTKPRRVVAAEWLLRYAPVIRLEIAISRRHAHIHADKSRCFR